MEWRVVVYRIATDVSRHRVAVWRELRRAGAVALQAATWAVPSGPDFDAALTRAAKLVERADGQMFVLPLASSEQADRQLQELFSAERDAEWAEFVTECDKALAELAEWTVTAKFTLAQLDEEEHNHERLRRWFRELRTRDLFGAAGVEVAEQKLKQCAAVLEDYADRVYQERQAT